MYFILICGKENFGKGLQHPASYSGLDKDALIRKAIGLRAEMERRPGNRGPYEIYVGEVTANVNQPIAYALLPLQNTSDDPGR